MSSAKKRRELSRAQHARIMAEHRQGSAEGQVAIWKQGCYALNKRVKELETERDALHSEIIKLQVSLNERWSAIAELREENCLLEKIRDALAKQLNEATTSERP